MRRLLAVVLAIGVATGTASAAGSWRTVVDHKEGFAITVPSTWQVVPGPTTALTDLIAALDKKRQTALANQFREIAAVRRATRVVYAFQAFAWPAPKGPVVPDVTVRTSRLKAGTTQSALARIARQVSKSLAASPNATAAAPVRRILPAGRAYEVTGTTRVTKTARSRYAIYLLIHAGTLYLVSFRGPAAATETGIANRFRFS